MSAGVGRCVVRGRRVSQFIALTNLRVPTLVSPKGFRKTRVCRSDTILAFLLPGICPLRRLVSRLRSRVRLVLLCRCLPSASASFNRGYYTCSGPHFNQVCGLGTATGKGVRYSALCIALCSSLRVVNYRLQRRLLGIVGGNRVLFTQDRRRLLESFI